MDEKIKHHQKGSKMKTKAQIQERLKEAKKHKATLSRMLNNSECRRVIKEIEILGWVLDE